MRMSSGALKRPTGVNWLGIALIAAGAVLVGWKR